MGAKITLHTNCGAASMRELIVQFVLSQLNVHGKLAKSKK